MKKIFFAAIAASMALASCHNEKGWSVEGTIANAGDSMLYIESATFNNWTVADSVKLTAAGHFSYHAAEPAALPSIYRLRLAGKYVYFAVDSMDVININSTLADFGTRYTLSGNGASEGMAKADSLITATVAKKGADAALADPSLKRELSTMINTDTTCILSYYIIGKTVGNKPVYNLTDRSDVRVLGNAANNFRRMRPEDPRGDELEQRWVAARQNLGLSKGKAVEMQATMHTRPDVPIVRYDVQGKAHDFNKLADDGKPTILNFTVYSGEDSQANNVALKQAYDAYSGQGLQIYQVSFDNDEMNWKRSAQNLPWIAVWNSATDPLDVLIAYNVDPVNGGSVSFVFNRNGELVERVTDPAKISAAVAKVM